MTSRRSVGGQGPAGPRSLQSLAHLQSHGRCVSTTVLHTQVCTSPRRVGAGQVPVSPQVAKVTFLTAWRSQRGKICECWLLPLDKRS